MGIEPTSPMFEGAKTAHALDRAATGIDLVSAAILIPLIFPDSLIVLSSKLHSLDTKNVVK